MENKKYLITGVAGFIGYSIAKRLINEGCSQLSLDNFEPYYDVELKKARISDLLSLNKDKFKFLKVDLKNAALVNAVIKDYKPDVICHVAAQAGVRHSLKFPTSYTDNNVQATLNILEAAKKHKVKDIVFASTSSVYGLNSEVPFQEDANIDSPLSVYAATKRACELLCYTYHHLYGIRFRILRFFTVYGPWGRPDMSPVLFANSIINQTPIKVYNQGKMMRDFTYIDDIVDGFIEAIKRPMDFEIINLGCGNPINLLDYITLIEKSLGKETEKILTDIQPGEMKDTWADISKAQKLLDYKPKVLIEEGIDNFTQWFKEYYKEG